MNFIYVKLTKVKTVNKRIGVLQRWSLSIQWERSQIFFYFFFKFLLISEREGEWVREIETSID